MSTAQDYATKEKPQWCPGCGNYGILAGIKSAMSELNLERKDTVIVSGVGCCSKIPHYISTYGYEGLHGRPLPLASAIKMANRRLTVIAMGGDGDGYGEGVQHFVHIARRNYDMTYIVHNNEIYGLTTGQASPTTKTGTKTKSTPFGCIETQFNPIANAIINGATFVSRTFAGNPLHMKSIMKQAIEHKGFALVDVFQPCVTFNKFNSYQWYNERIYDLQGTGYQPTDKMKALEMAYEDQKTNFAKVPIGVFYKELRPTYDDQLPQMKGKELVDSSLAVDITELCEELK